MLRVGGVYRCSLFRVWQWKFNGYIEATQQGLKSNRGSFKAIYMKKQVGKYTSYCFPVLFPLTKLEIEYKPHRGHPDDLWHL